MRLDAERTRVDAYAEATKREAHKKHTRSTREARGKHADAARTQRGVLWRFETRADAQREAHGKRTGRRGKHTGRRGKHTRRIGRRVGRIGTHRDAQRDAQERTETHSGTHRDACRSGAAARVRPIESLFHQHDSFRVLDI